MAENRFRFTNEKCPVCDNTFEPDDDIVVCPHCGTPHHRECYKQNGNCKNAEKHNSDFRWESSPQEQKIPDEATFQARVQRPMEENPNFPPFAPFGMPFAPPQNNPLNLFPLELEDGVSTTDVATFVQQDSLKYIQKFFYIKGGKRTINWAALFFAPYWFFYRKMYKLGAVFMAIQLCIAFLSFLPPVERLYATVYEHPEQIEALTTSDISSDEMYTAMNNLSQSLSTSIQQNRIGAGLVVFQSVLSVAVTIYVGLNANKWYYKHVVTEIKKINEQNPDKEKRALLLYKAGGVSYSAAFLSVLVEKIFIYGFELILMMFAH